MRTGEGGGVYAPIGRAVDGFAVAMAAWTLGGARAQGGLRLGRAGLRRRGSGANSPQSLGRALRSPGRVGVSRGGTIF
jgi:hypothetical protein